ncbi:protein EARLY FLOWERING 3-like [Wolffia australiana]
MMKRGREEEKFSGPLFPRLHVNDADKGGPRAPPRNKMALYEEFSIPSQRFKPGSSSTMPFASHHGSSLVSSISSSQGYGHERSGSSSFYMRSQIPSSLSSDKLKKKPFKPVSQRATSVECSSPLPRVIPTEKQPPKEKSEEEQFHVPVYSQQRSELASDPDRHVVEGPRSSCISMNKTQNGEGISDHDAGNLSEVDRDLGRSSDDAEPCDEDKCGSSGSTGKTSSSADGTMDRAVADDRSENWMLESGEGRDVTPDSVVGLIGPKHFWKARRAIINQQRVFALQVFELHRLMNVQKLLAGSPNLLLEDASSFHGPKPQPTESITPRVDETEEPTKVRDDDEEKDLPSPSPPSDPPKSEAKPGPWCIHVAGDHWLVPVMSQTEGLVYKPFTAGNSNPGGPPVAPLYNPQSMVLPPGYMPPYNIRPPPVGSVAEQGSFLSGRNKSNPRESELQSSTGSSAAESSARVIRVVPHNRKTASASAVRIFQSIQKERQGFDPA